MVASLVRKSAYAGSFYPSSELEVKKQLFALSATAGVQHLPKHPPILIVPHAGWIYSGLAAMRGIATLVDSPPKRIVLIGPSHRHMFLGFSLAGYEKYRTPIGEIEGDLELQEEISSSTGFVFVPEADEREHSLEVIFPMLQHYLHNGFKVLPIQAGSPTLADMKRLADALASLLDPLSDSVIVSTDLSHFFSYDEARKLDDETIGYIVEGNYQALLERSGEGGRLCCGVYGVVTAILLAKKWGLGVPKVLMRHNSGDSGGDLDRVVGYASIAYLSPEIDSDKDR
jgi:MEMO1 family protein